MEDNANSNSEDRQSFFETLFSKPAYTAIIISLVLHAIAFWFLVPLIFRKVTARPNAVTVIVVVVSLLVAALAWWVQTSQLVDDITEVKENSNAILAAHALGGLLGAGFMRWFRRPPLVFAQ